MDNDTGVDGVGAASGVKKAKAGKGFLLKKAHRHGGKMRSVGDKIVVNQKQEATLKKLGVI